MVDGAPEVAQHSVDLSPPLQKFEWTEERERQFKEMEELERRPLRQENDADEE
jgi:hypothetical protein